MLLSRLTVLPTSWRGAGLGFLSRVGVRGQVVLGFGAPAGRAVFARMFRNPRRTRAGVSRPGAAGFSQGRRRSVGEGPGEAELGVGGDDQPGPAVGGLRGAELRAGPAEGLFEQPEGVFQVEAAQERLPPAVDVGGGGAGGRGPQPHRLGVTVAGQVLDLQADQGALDDGEVAVVVEPAGAAGQPGVQPVPAARLGRCRSGWSPWWCGAAAPARCPACRSGTPGRAWAGGRSSPVARGGFGSRSTRSERIRPSSSTGRSARTKARRVTS